MIRNKAPQIRIEECDTLPNGYAQARLSGRLDADSALMLGDWLEEVIAAGALGLELDLSELDFVSSTGIGCLVAATAQFRDEDGDLILISPQQTLYESLMVLNLEDFLTIRRDDR